MKTERWSGTMGRWQLATSPVSCASLKGFPVYIVQILSMHHTSSVAGVGKLVLANCVCLCVCLRPAVQNNTESYGGLPEDSRGEPYNSSKDSTLMMREVMNDKHTHTQLYFSPREDFHWRNAFLSFSRYVVSAQLASRRLVFALIP